MNRRKFLNQVSLTAGSLIFSDHLLKADSFSRHIANNLEYDYPIGVCDWMILKRQKLGAFKLAKEIGVNGVEVDMGGLGTRKTFDNKLVDSEARKAFQKEAASYGLHICALAMSAFYSQSIAERENAEDLIRECIGIMKRMEVKVAFLPFGIQGDLVKYPQLRPVLVRKLRAVSKEAERAGVIIGIETALDAKGELELLKDIGSPAIQSYFNFENPLQEGRDLYNELKILGKDHICQIHCTDRDGFWLQDDPLIDMEKVRKTLDEMGWKGWLVMERSRDANDPYNVLRNYGANAKYLRKVFQ